MSTAGLTRMNMILHDFPTANVLSDDTLATPKFKDGERLRTYDYVVANPPFSDKTWSTGLIPTNDAFQRFAELTKGKMAVLISHRFSTVRMADRILVLKDGGIIEQGTHEELLRQRGLYAELFNLQAVGYK